MEQNTFKKRVEKLGQFRRQKNGYFGEAYQDYIFEPNEYSTPCPDCLGKGRILHYQLKEDRKGRKYWQTKCGFCKNLWEGFLL